MRLLRLLLTITIALLPITFAKVQSNLKCVQSTMVIEIKRPEDVSNMYLEGLRDYPDKACKPVVNGNMAVFTLDVKDFYQCGITRILSENTKTYLHTVVIERYKGSREELTVKCIHSRNHTIAKRNVLPAGFQEPLELDITSSVTEVAPQPKLQVGVRQAGQLVTGELNVNPGTPLQMEIYLDKESAPVYGILVSYMQVSDTKHQEESIIFNGCSVDPYLFENFNTVDGDFLTAKFRAFKFPDSTYVQFKGTVNVCLDKCRGVDCSNGQTGYGRRKRNIPEMPPDPNKVFEVSITSFFKVNYKGDNIVDKVKLDAGPESAADLGERGTSVHEVLTPGVKKKVELSPEDADELEDIFYNVLESRSTAPALAALPLLLLIPFLLQLH